MKRKASTKSLNANSRWSLPLVTAHPDRFFKRSAISVDSGCFGRDIGFSSRRVLSRRWCSHDGRALDVFVADLADVEGLDVLDELPERLVEAWERLALAGERRGPGEDEVFHVRVLDPALRELGYGLAERGVGRAHELGALLALRQRLREVALQELVDAAQDRGEGPAREARIAFVEKAERDEVGRLELKRVVVLPGVRLLFGEAPIHADHLEGLFLEVVRLLRVEREDLERDLRLGNEDGGDHLGLELGEHR